ncbi:Protein prenyltransferase alpha subunit repeat-containing protein 1 [Camellia lanceoleosa]|uniref:Protein prenyltransferase alpha subunit repeat-containing protein 1 n=1 Tax=Camellia lanceoleosa TaxID=1840588 RepID=A0ACC0IVP4_9ERIC|nr:Protein prenyltransferase alpha subunit repeat-containing protein 1 [Camellia lanceoleosa]
MTQLNPLELLKQLEDILDSDPLIDEVGFIHPSQFVTLNEEAGSPLPSSVGTMLQSEDRVLGSRVSKVNPSETVFWCRDHKLGISTQVLLPLYNVAKQTFMAALERYKMHSNLSVKKDESGSDNMSSWYASSLDILESEVMKHSRALLLLSCDFGTVWNSRKLVLSNKQHSQIFVDELLLSALVLSYAPKSECSWSHRRWVIKMIDGKSSNLQEIVEKESEIVKKIAEKSKMNYRAWNHRCWLVSHMSGGQVLNELNKSRGWTGLHIADSSCFHYRTRLMLRMLEELQHKQDPVSSSSYNAELRQLWKEELDWNEMLIKQYIGREALWLHRRFLSFCWIKHFVTDIHDISSHSDHKNTMNHEIGIFMDTELELVCSCSTIPDNDFEDFQAQAMFSATYIMWLTKQISEFLGIEFREKLPAEELKTIINRVCPEKIFLWHSFQGTHESV